MATASLDRVYTYHPPFGNQAERYITLRKAAKQFAELIQQLAPPSRETSVALTNVQQAVMWANAAIAINEQAPPVPTEDSSTAKVQTNTFIPVPAESVAANQESV